MNYYRINLYMKEKWGFSLTEIEDMVPFEREIYLITMRNIMEERKEEAQNGRQHYEARADEFGGH